MNHNIPDSHLALEDDLALMQVSYTFALASVWLENGMAGTTATFDLVVRTLPEHRNYLVAGGLEEMLTWLRKLRFSEAHIGYLSEHGLVSAEMKAYLENFRFSGTVLAMPEGTVFFGQEPMLRVTAPIVEAALVEMYLITAAVSNAIYFTKSARLFLAADNKFTVTTGPARGVSFESMFKATRAACLCGLSSPATPSINMKYGQEVDKFWINSQHLFVTSFPTELEAFRALAKLYPDNCGLLIDTYEAKRGIEHAVTVAKELRAGGHNLASIYIDSGDRFELVAYARKRLAEEGIAGTSITIAGGMDEHTIAEYAAKGLDCNAVTCIEELMTVNDSPKLDFVYKMAELRDADSVTPTAKLTSGKESYPGRKQVFRNLKDGKLDYDVVGLEDEDLSTPLLEKVMEDGKLCVPLPDWDQIRAYTAGQLALLPDGLKELDLRQEFEVRLSEGVLNLLEEVKTNHK